MSSDDAGSSSCVAEVHDELSKQEMMLSTEEEEAGASSLPEQEVMNSGVGVTSSSSMKSSDVNNPPPNNTQVLLRTIGPAYAKPSCPTAIFYIETLGIILLGALTALCSLAYNNIYYVVSAKWMTDDVEQLAVFLGGEPYWIGVGAGTGIVVGVLKAYVFKFDEYKGFIEVILDLDVDIKESFSMAVVGLVSLMGGASLGPESGLAGVGGLLGKISVKPMNALCRRALGSATDEDVTAETKRRKLLVLSACVSAFATMLPTPASSVMFCLELMGAAAFVAQGFVWLRSVVQLGLGATVSNLVYTSLVGFTTINVEATFPGYNHQTLKWKNTGVAILFALCTPFCLFIPYLVVAGITKFSKVKLQAVFESKVGDKGRIVCMATLGGVIYGLIGYILPLTPGDGSYQMAAVIQRGSEIESSVLVVSAYAKMLTYWVSAEFGFVGGVFHPLLMISLLFGRMIINETTVNETIGTALSFILLAASFTPLPFSMFLLDLALFNLKASDQVSIFLAIVIAHLATTGVGFPQWFLSKAMSSGKKTEENGSVGREQENSKA